ncbi:glycosyltransferase family 2 protein [Leptospira fluminis]|uniref:Glycosyltransferase family 2 protein n=1 Tax=Leptospira fluminis TaxID=2484979 RepID=A0A4R9GTJ7_9LEPT|nr:glycosyltransferase [Leptospira fluminis]TGK22221.1 glycosyltransferase family 2 protein [Leptospira fluminis]
MRPDVSVLIPTYNEAENINLIVGRVSNILKKENYEILIIDDNSPDGTWRIAEELGENDERIRIIRRMGEKGLSSAVMTGMASARGKYFVVMDADLQHDENILPQMIGDLSSGFDLAVGTRYASGGSVGKWSALRSLMSRFATWFARRFLPIGVSDPMSGFFGLKKEVFDRVENRMNPRGFKILLEILGRSKVALKVAEIPYIFRNRARGDSKLDNSVVRNFLVAILDIRFGKWVSPTFLLYCIVGFLGVFVNIGGFLFLEAAGFGEVHTGFRILPKFSLSVLFGIELSVISNFVLNNYFTFYERRYFRWDALRGFLIFSLVSVLGIFVQLSVFHFLYYRLLPEFGSTPGWEARLVCDLLAIALAMFTNYLLNSNVTWMESKKSLSR